MKEAVAREVLITNDATVLGLVALILGGIFYTVNSSHRFWVKFYKYVPAILLCYFIPSLLNTFDVVDGGNSNLYYVASRFLLPACLVLLTMTIDLKAIAQLGPKALIMFLTGTVGIMIGGPIAVFVASFIFPDLMTVQGQDSVWRGMTTVAGSWIGGNANQAAMKEIYEVGGDVFSAMIAVDVLVANIWMTVILFFVARAKDIDKRTGADTEVLDGIRDRIEAYQAKNARMPVFYDYIKMCMIGFGVTGFSHFAADIIAPFFVEHYPELQRYSLHSKFFWMVVIATTIAIILSFTKARKIEAAGSSNVATVFLYILITSIGLHMDVSKILDSPAYFVIGLIWMSVHVLLMVVMTIVIKAPFFYMAVGSQANVGGAASAPVVASAFHPSLAPVGVLLAILGYGIGTYAAWICGQLMFSVSP
ncbi:DUF819 family protein [Algicola sagamiensis]|uniref:DUF819 family protein n=1 Tax=Algicola sagamiensis TaxID=163869 RepID=UPI00036108DF|nr:DUF819 family protein [Algicola sagamiensis]